MNYKVDALMNFLACEFSDSLESSKHLLSEPILKQAAELDFQESPDTLKSTIYSIYQEFGIDNARGVFEMTVVQSSKMLC